MTGILKKRKVGLFLALLWVALFCLCLSFPYTGDDWAWGSSIGIERLTSLFANYNGRYFGNLLVLLLTRNIILRSLVVSGVLVAIIYELYSISGKHRFSTLVVSAILLLLVHYRIGAQSIVWVSGFTNYVVPTLLVLIYINESKALLTSNHEQIIETPLRCVGMFVLALSNALFMENITLFGIAASVVMLAYCRIVNGFWSKEQLAFAVGAVIGALIMFSNGAYWIIAAGQDGYRSVADDASSSIPLRLADTMTYYLVINNWAIPTCLFLTMAYAIAGNGSKAQNTIAKPTAITVMDIIAAFVMLGVSMVSVYCTFCTTSEPGPIREKIVIASSLLFAISLTWYLIMHGKERFAQTSLLLVVGVVFIATPLLVVNPIGPRNFFPTYALECAVACCMWDNLVDDPSKMLVLVLDAVLAAVIIRWCSIYLTVHEADASRNAAVASAVASGKQSIRVAQLPYEGYVHCPDPADELWEKRYKLFYGIPEDFEIEMR